MNYFSNLYLIVALIITTIRISNFENELYMVIFGKIIELDRKKNDNNVDNDFIHSLVFTLYSLLFKIIIKIIVNKLY